jgi:putative transcriptional regulator
MIRHHPPLEVLLDFASGSLPEPVALVVAAHADLCAACREEIATFEVVGGEMLAEIEPVSMSENALDAVMARLDASESFTSVAVARASAPATIAPTCEAAATAIADLISPSVLAHLGGDLSRLVWRKVGGLFEEIKLPISVKGFKASLMRLKPNSMIPMHTHRGREYTLVLAGGFRENGSQYDVGDFTLRDASDIHRPVVDGDEGCVCLMVLDAPIKLTGMIGRLVNPFLRM